MRNASAQTAAVRLEGGLGDHLLGMRVLPFVRQRFPHHRIVAFSDAGGHAVQPQAVAMSPLVDEVVPLQQRPEALTSANIGSLSNLEERDLARMRSADVFIEAWGNSMFVPAARTLDVPVFDILADRPRLAIPTRALAEASRRLDAWDGYLLVGMNLGKAVVTALESEPDVLRRFLAALLEDSRVVIVNLFTTAYDFPHWPEPLRTERRTTAEREGRWLQDVTRWHDRIVSCADLPIQVTAAVLSRCRYYIGVDNGIKHLAWALGIPRTVLSVDQPDTVSVMRWIPDVNRVLVLSEPPSELARHVETARCALAVSIETAADVVTSTVE